MVRVGLNEKTKTPTTSIPLHGRLGVVKPSREGIRGEGVRPVTRTVAPEVIVPPTEGPDVSKTVLFVHGRIQEQVRRRPIGGTTPLEPVGRETNACLRLTYPSTPGLPVVDGNGDPVVVVPLHPEVGQ